MMLAGKVRSTCVCPHGAENVVVFTLAEACSSVPSKLNLGLECNHFFFCILTLTVKDSAIARLKVCSLWVDLFAQRALSSSLTLHLPAVAKSVPS